jgi:hypothetical protein
MRFHNHVPEEARELLREQLAAYKKEIAMTPDERKEPHKWVARGRSPYDNGNYVYGENGWPLDFVRALRSDKELFEYYSRLSDEELAEYNKTAIPDDFNWVSECNFENIDFPELPFS